MLLEVPIGVNADTFGHGCASWGGGIRRTGGQGKGGKFVTPLSTLSNMRQDIHSHGLVPCARRPTTDLGLFTLLLELPLTSPGCSGCFPEASEKLLRRSHLRPGTKLAEQQNPTASTGRLTYCKPVQMSCFLVSSPHPYSISSLHSPFIPLFSCFLYRTSLFTRSGSDNARPTRRARLWEGSTLTSTTMHF